MLSLSNCLHSDSFVMALVCGMYPFKLRRNFSRRVAHESIKSNGYLVYHMRAGPSRDYEWLCHCIVVALRRSHHDLITHDELRRIGLPVVFCPISCSVISLPMCCFQPSWEWASFVDEVKGLKDVVLWSLSGFIKVAQSCSIVRGVNRILLGL
jgi:hypothetical protein